MTTVKTGRALLRGLQLLTLASLLSACGFITAPLGLASAEVASSSVKAADYSLESGRKAASFVQEKTVQGAQSSRAYLQRVVDGLGTPSPAEQTDQAAEDVQLVSQ